MIKIQQEMSCNNVTYWYVVVTHGVLLCICCFYAVQTLVLLPELLGCLVRLSQMAEKFSRQKLFCLDAFLVCGLSIISIACDTFAEPKYPN